MKNYLKVAMLILLSQSIFSQTKTNIFKQNFSGSDKRIVILSGSNILKIEGTTGTEIIIERSSEQQLPAEAEGLKMIIPGGLVDNTGIGANITVEGIGMKIKIPKSKYYGNYIVKIPQDISISVRESNNSYAKWTITGMKNEIEIEASYSAVTLKNISGPLVARCGYGNLYVEYDQLNQQRPNSIWANNVVDITLPTDTKADLKVTTSNGDFFTDFDIMPIKKVVKTEESKATSPLNIEIEAVSTIIDLKQAGKVKEKSVNSDNVLGYVSTDDFINQKSWSPESVRNWTNDKASSTNNNSTINGGGVSLKIISNYGNIYLRKKK